MRETKKRKSRVECDENETRDVFTSESVETKGADKARRRVESSSVIKDVYDVCVCRRGSRDGDGFQRRCEANDRGWQKTMTRCRRRGRFRVRGCFESRRATMEASCLLECRGCRERAEQRMKMR